MIGVETHPCGPPGTDVSCSQTFFLLFQAVLSPLIAIALKISQIHERTGRRGPTVITWMEERSLTRAKECAQRGTLHSCLLASCLCLWWLWKKKKMICWLWGVGGCRWGKKSCFVWVLVSFCKATGSSVVCESHTAFRYLCFVTRGNLPFW